MEQCNINQLFTDMTANNDEEAFKLFYNQCFVRLLRYAYSLTRSREVAEEIANDVFMHCWQKRGSLGDIKNPEVYLFVVARNKSVDYKRKQAQFKAVDLNPEDHIQITFDSNPEELMITSEMVRKMESTIQQLPPKCKAIYLMIKQHGLKYKEVAQILNVSVKTVENQLSIAIKRLTAAVKFTLEKEDLYK
ncbi:RNA polymerase sigma-70 factor, ECF subfamily [Chitinophaga jiangningensis]|uniref:RNA polymerase sigma-70 factor, ECF subfamily n=2 Tax=Chitinophaga jiangningensis TaxID=1419482 RepID=A0A1M7FHE7_9BACT|nr:RNA polymerase sigma-70 factor, ECF subfamily [Chitinophaga jiangningensis]